MPVTRASEIGSYLYCRRAWWYRRQGYESANVTELAAGTRLHERHGAGLLGTNLTRALGLLLLGLSILTLVAWLVSQFR